MKQFFQALIFSVALFASGCVSLLPASAPPKPRYHISSIEIAPSDSVLVNWSLAIDDPRATRAYDTTKIAVSTAPGKIEYFAGAEWADRAPRLFQIALTQSFEDSGQILAVGDRHAVPIADLVLQSDIRKLELNVHNGERSASISIFVRLTNGRGKVFAAKRFDASASASSDSADHVLAAFDEAFDVVIKEMSAWTFDEGEKAAGAAGA